MHALDTGANRRLGCYATPSGSDFLDGHVPAGRSVTTASCDSTSGDLVNFSLNRESHMRVFVKVHLQLTHFETCPPTRTYPRSLRRLRSRCMPTVAMSTLPPFLQRLPPDPTIQETCVNAAFPHPKLGTSAHALWWPANVEQPRVVLMMIPGILRNSAVQYDTMSFN